MSAPSGLTHPGRRLGALLDEAELTTADAAWLSTGGGLVAAAQRAVAEADSSVIDRLERSGFAERIADLSPAFDSTGAHVHARVAGLVAAVRLARWSGGPVEGPVVGWVEAVLRAAHPAAALEACPPSAADAVDLLDRIRSGDPAAGLAARELVVALIGEPGPAGAASVEFPVSRLAGGDLYTLTVRRVPGATGLAQDLAAGLFTRADQAFREACHAAWAAANPAPASAAVWSVRSSRSELPVAVVTGPSGGLAAAVAAAALDDLHLAAAARGWLFTGRVGAGGAVESLRPTAGAGEYPQKLAACTGRRVMVPEADAALVAPLADTAHVAKLIGVSSLDDTVAGLVRHAAATHAFNEAFSSAGAGAYSRDLDPLDATVGSEPAPGSRLGLKRRRRRLLVAGAVAALTAAALLALVTRPGDPAPGGAAQGAVSVEAAGPASLTPLDETPSTTAEPTTTDPSTTTEPSTSTSAASTTTASPPRPAATTPTTSTPATTPPETTTTATSPPAPKTGTAPSDVPGAPLEFGASASGASPGLGAPLAPLYRVQLAGGETARITVNSDPALNAVAVFGPETTSVLPNKYLFYCLANGPSFVRYFKADTDGTYYLQVRSLTPASFTIQVDRAGDSPDPTCTPRV
ncbi:MAG: hypothetical protein ACKVWR_03475 [Acidimicrobiales bacterium]